MSHSGAIVKKLQVSSYRENAEPGQKTDFVCQLVRSLWLQPGHSWFLLSLLTEDLNGFDVRADLITRLLFMQIQPAAVCLIYSLFRLNGYMQTRWRLEEGGSTQTHLEMAFIIHPLCAQREGLIIESKSLLLWICLDLRAVSQRRSEIFDMNWGNVFRLPAQICLLVYPDWL